MKGMAIAAIAGNLTKDPELRTTSGGTSVCSISIAVNDKRKQGQEWVDYVSYFDAVAWGSQAEYIATYFQKGQPVMIEGELRQRRWEAQDGTKRSAVETTVRHISSPGGKRDEAEREQPRPQTPEPKPFNDEDDIPF